MRIFLTLILSMLFVSASAQESAWVYQEKPDEMRGTVTRIATLASTKNSPATAIGLSAFITVADLKTGGVGIIVDVKGDVLRCPAEECQVLAKFDNGAIKTLTGPSENGDHFFAPWNQGAVLGAIQYTDRLIVEMDLMRNGRQQFVFRPAGLPISVERNPLTSVLKYQYGTPREEVKGLGDSIKADADQVCYNSLNPGPVVMDGIDGSGMVCFVKNRLYLVVLNTTKADKKALAKLQEHLDVIYGKGDSYSSAYTHWPRTSDGMDRFTSDAARLGETFIFSDESLDLFAPERKRQD